MDRLCRVCMDSSVTLVDIFADRQQTSKKDPSLAEMLNEFCVVNPQDSLPQSICLSCVLAAQNAYKFKRTCEESNRQLLLLLAMRNQESCNYIVPCVEAVYQNEEIPVNISSIKQEPVPQDEVITGDIVQTPLKEKTKGKLVDRRRINNFSNQNRQRQQISKEYTHKCRYCGKGFHGLYPLRLHEKRHTGEKSCFCVTCGKGFIRAHDLKIHTRIHTGERFQCPHCPRSFIQMHILRTHMEKHNVPQGQTVSPVKIKKIAPKKALANSKEQSNKIIVEQNVEKPLKATERGLRDKLPAVSYEELDMECEFNDIATMLTTHHSMATPSPKKLEKAKNLDQTERKKPISTLKNKEPCQNNEKMPLHFCDTCGRGFLRRYALTQHIRTHTGERPYKCNICPGAFTQGQALKRHIRQVHNNKFVRKELQIPPPMKRVVVRVARIQLPRVLTY